jgi:hypothetical protein
MIPYRVEQVWRFLSRRPQAEDVAWVRRTLAPAQQALFFSQQPGDQAHAIRVARALIAEGHHDERLIRAALLHDVGKAPGVPMPYRVAVVLLKRVAPARLDRLSPRAAGWLAPLARAHHHPKLGASLARAARCHPDVATLIEHHQDHDAKLPGDLNALLAALQAVDDRS